MVEWPATARPASGAPGSARQSAARDVIVMRSGSVEVVEYATAGRMMLPTHLNAPDNADNANGARLSR
jgi:hypothetical protein